VIFDTFILQHNYAEVQRFPAAHSIEKVIGHSRVVIILQLGGADDPERQWIPVLSATLFRRPFRLVCYGVCKVMS
jgi:hypothetical protein